MYTERIILMYSAITLNMTLKFFIRLTVSEVHAMKIIYLHIISPHNVQSQHNLFHSRIGTVNPFMTFI